LELRKKKDVLSEERSDEFHVFPETRRRAEAIQSRYTATKGKSPEVLLTDREESIRIYLILHGDILLKKEG